MKALKNSSKYKKIALILSLCALILWAILGTGASMAWFSDTSPEINNIFHFADLDIEVEHLLTDGNWEKVDSTVQIFNNEALYEPGYTQVVYLRVRNAGDCEFNFNTAVNVTKKVVATNYYDEDLDLCKYLKFGFVTDSSFDNLKDRLSERDKAKFYADSDLNAYSSDTLLINKNETKYVALVVTMPEMVGNEANYSGDTQPMVELGVIFKAEQVVG